jgi:hypothetical protein
MKCSATTFVRLSEVARTPYRNTPTNCEGFAPVAMTVQVRNRLTQEGGRNVGVPLRQ